MRWGWNVFILGMTSLLTDISTEMVYPLLPMFLTAQLGATPAMVGLIEGIAESLAGLLKTFSGLISDHLGRRKPLAICGYAFSAISKVLFVLAISWNWVLAGRVLDRFGKGIRTAPRDALLADSASPATAGRVFGFHRAMDSLGAFLGVILAYLLIGRDRVDYAGVFLWSLVPAVLGVLFLALIREGRAADPGEPARLRRPSPAELRRAWMLLDPRLRAFLGITFLFTLGNSSNQFLLLRAGSSGFSPADVLLLYLLYNAVYTLSSYPAGFLADRAGRRVVLVAGYAAYGLVYLGFAVAQGAAWFWVLFAAYGLYSGLTEGVGRALVADLAPPGQRATLLGLHAAIVGVGLFPASYVAGLSWNVFGPSAPFILGASAGLAAALAMWRLLGTAGLQAVE